MHGMFTYIYYKNQLNVGKYTIPMDPMGKFKSENGKISPSFAGEYHQDAGIFQPAMFVYFGLV